MKTRPIIYALIGTAMLAASCSSEVNDLGAGDAGNVEFAVEIPSQSGSRAISDGLSARELHYALYKKTATGYELLTVKNAGEVFSGKQATLSLQLVNGLQYRVAFVAKAADAPYAVDAATGTLKMQYGSETANSDKYDAFYGTKDVTVSASTGTQTVTLTRPFAQINIGAMDWQTAKDAGYTVSASGMAFTTQVYSTMNLLDGSVSNPVEVTYAMAALPDASGPATDPVPAKLTVGGDKYDWTGMNYVLVGAEKNILPTMTFSYAGPSGAVDLQINAVPAQRNHRTNIIGNFFTSTTDYKIIIDEDFEEEDFDVNN